MFKKLSFVLACSLLCSVTPLMVGVTYCEANVLYVNCGVASSGDGRSWDTAFKTIPEAITAAIDGDEIWVKKGSYLLSSQIEVNKAISLYGGFAGTETQREQRNLADAANETIVDGNNATRCFAITANATVDGFTIKKGYVSEEVSEGGGVYSSSESVSISNCNIIGNTSSQGWFSAGGGIANHGGLDLTNCLITNNAAVDGFVAVGGGISNDNWDESGNPAMMRVVNCTMVENRAVTVSNPTRGDGIFNGDSLTVINSIIWGNGEEIYCGTDCSVTYSDIQGGYPGEGNIDVDPLLTSDFCLLPVSPCIDAGTSDGAPPTDAKCMARCDNPEIPNAGAGQFPYYDMGWCEFACDGTTDTDGDGIPDTADNCPNDYNPVQEDSYPPQSNGIGDACDCEGNFNCLVDHDVDGSDASIFKADFGRSSFNRPCIAGDTCKGDFTCDGDVDGTDASLFKSDFGRSSLQHACPMCASGVEWCVY